MRIRVVLHYLGLVLVAVGLLMIFPLAWSLYYREPDIIPFIISIGITVGSGLILTFLTPGGEGKLSTREALALVAGAWIVASAFSTLPYMLAGTFHSYLNAYFEAMSGYTTTGASVLTNIESQPHGILLWRNFTQWLGGMGIITLFVAVFPMLGVGPAHLVEAELPGETGRLTARIRDTAKALWQIYLGITALEIILLFLAGMPLFDSFANAFGTMATGGFSPKNLSIGAYDSVSIHIIIIFFMALAGINFGIYYSLLWKRNLGRLFRDVEFRVYLGILIVASLLISLDLFLNTGSSAGDALRYGTFQAVSIQTTTGFAITNFNVWPAFSRSALIILMVIGASAGSTGGALKVSRVVILVKYAYRELVHVFNPRAVLPVKLGERALPEWVLSRILGVAIIYVITFVVAFLLMSAVGLDFVSALSSVAATLGNIGPGLGMVGPTLNYSLVPPLGKIVLIVCMLVGRLELWTVLVLISPAFWRWR